MLIVVMIIGILATVSLTVLTDARDRARQETFASNLRDLSRMSSVYYQGFQALPSQEAGGPIPPEMLQHVGRDEFPLFTPVGGFWHVGKFTSPNRWGVGVWWPTEEQADVQPRCEAVDATIDDGVLTTGRFVSLDGTRYYWLVD